MRYEWIPMKKRNADSVPGHGIYYGRLNDLLQKNSDIQYPKL